MKYLARLFIASVLVFIMVACSDKPIKGNGEITQRTKALSDIRVIRAKGPFSLQLTQTTDVSQFSVIADKNLQPDILATIKDHTLILSTKKGTYLRPSQPIVITVSSPELQAIHIKGRVKVKLLDMHTPNLLLEAHGVSQAILFGHTDAVHLTIFDDATVDASHLIAKHVLVSTKGASTAQVYAQKTLSAAVFDACKVTYFGNPDQINHRLSKGAKLEAAPGAHTTN